MKRLLCLVLAAASAVAGPSVFAESSTSKSPEPPTRTKDSGSAPLSPSERAELLARLEALKAKAPSLQAAFSESRTSRLLKKPVASSGSIAFQAPNKFRREVTGSNPSLTASNGKVLWIYYPNFKEAELYTLGRRAMFDDAMAALTAGLNFGRVEAFYNLAAFREDDGYRITLTPKKSNLKRIVRQLTVHLDGELDVRRTELVMPKGDEVVTNYTNVRRTTLPASTFEFKPPAGANVTTPLGK